MVIESIKLENFRNYETLELQLDPGTNIFYGENAQGKTNILESVYLCGTTKSHKGSRDREMIRFDQEEAHIRMKLDRAGSSYSIDMHLKKNRPKGIAINGVPIRKAGELLGLGNFVFFSPEDLNITKAAGRTETFCGSGALPAFKVYLFQLSNYNKILNQRNKLLKEISFRPEYLDTLDVWDSQLVQYGQRVIQERELFVSRLNEIIAESSAPLRRPGDPGDPL